MEFDQVQRIGVFKFKHIGDVLLMTPALRELKRRFPQARLTAVVHAFAAPMLANNPDVDEVIAAEHLVKKDGTLARLKQELGLLRRIRKQKFDLTLDFGANERAIWCSWLGGAKIRAAQLYHKWEPGDWQRRLLTHLYPEPWCQIHRNQTHQVLKDIWLVRQLGQGTPAGLKGKGEPADVITPEDTMERHPLVLRPSNEDQEWAETFLRPHRAEKIVVMHPVSRWMSKCWHAERMAAVLDWLQRERGARVILTSSPDTQEIAYAQAIEDQAQTRPVMVPGTIHLGQLGALIHTADAFVGIDSAPMHMAAAVDTPQVALFGATNPIDWGPWSPHAKALFHPLDPQDPKLQNVPKHTVHPAMDLITIEDVQRELEAILS